MNIDKYHPIRQRMVWVLIIQSVASALVLAGISTELLVEEWSQWLAGVLNILVLAGVLAAGTHNAEENTVPIDDAGNPLNQNYAQAAPPEYPGNQEPGPERPYR